MNCESGWENLLILSVSVILFLFNNALYISSMVLNVKAFQRTHCLTPAILLTRIYFLCKAQCAKWTAYEIKKNIYIWCILVQMSGGQVSFVKYVSRVCKKRFHIPHSHIQINSCVQPQKTGQHTLLSQHSRSKHWKHAFHMGFKELSCSARHNSTRTCSVCILTAKLKLRQVLKQATQVFVAW